MNHKIEIRIANPSERTRGNLDAPQIAMDKGDLIVVRISSLEYHFDQVVARVREILSKVEASSEFVSFLECRFNWSPQEFEDAAAFALCPFRRYYREVENEGTLYEDTDQPGLGYVRVQRSLLVLPDLKDTGSELRYLSNGALVVSKSLKERLEVFDLHELKFVPVNTSGSTPTGSCRLLDLCIVEELPDMNYDSNWFQMVSTNVSMVDPRGLDPLDFYSHEPSDFYQHVFPDHSGPLKGKLDSKDGSFTDIAFGGEPMGLWHNYRPLIISKRLLPVFQGAKQKSVLIDPFFPE